MKKKRHLVGNIEQRFLMVASLAMLHFLLTGCDTSKQTDGADVLEKAESAAKTKKNSSKKHNPSKKLPSTREAVRRAKSVRPNVVVFLIDTLRKDHLSCYGYKEKTSPRIDALAENGLLFERAVSQAPWTPASVSSLFTSRYPSQLGIAAKANKDGIRRGGSVPRLRKRFHTLAEAFRKARYQTFAVSTNMYVSRKFHLLQGFQGRKRKTKARASWVAAQGIKWLSRKQENGRPFFLYLHFMDAHETHTRYPFRKIYYSDQMKNRASLPKNKGFDRGEHLGTREFIEWKNHRIAIYDGAITYIDNYIGDIVDFLKDENLFDNTIFAVLSDHGEEFWDHVTEAKAHIPQGRDMYGMGHGHSLFGELTDVPMILYGPRVPVGRDTSLVRNLDVSPTLLKLVGLPAGRFLKEGRNLLDKKTGTVSPPLAFSESIAYGREAKSIQDEQFKLIKNDDYQFFYDKKNDPHEKSNLGKRHPDRRAALEKAMNDIVNRTTLQTAMQPEVLDQETENQLKALGYL